MDKRDVPGYQVPANALRQQGLRKVPGFWIKEEDMPIVFALADKTKEQVRQIQNEVNTRNTELKEKAENQSQPKTTFNEAALDVDWPGMN